MRTQKFGVEIETKGLTREEAARVIARALGGTASGTHATDPATGKVWKAVRDGSLTGVSAEVVTPILAYEEIPKLQKVIRALRGAGARVDPRETGLHVHVDGSRHDAKSLARLVKLINSKEELLFKALQVNEARLARYARRVDQGFLRRIVRRAPEDLRQLNRAWYGREDLHPMHYSATRYFGLNLHAVWDKGTVEFRYFNGSLNAGKVKAYVQLCLALSHKALTGHGASHRPTRTTNEKFTFRVWLVGLGLKGPEFKTARKHLTANLSGNSAWRNGSPTARRRRAATETRAPATTESALNTVHLENWNDGHFKFYRIEWNGCLKVRTAWGRIGTEGRSKEERFEDDAVLQAYVEQTLQTRLRHGYAVVSDSRQGR
jgi:predicted DNA-binding WGR domain protein